MFFEEEVRWRFLRQGLVLWDLGGVDRRTLGVWVPAGGGGGGFGEGIKRVLWCHSSGGWHGFRVCGAR